MSQIPFLNIENVKAGWPLTIDDVISALKIDPAIHHSNYIGNLIQTAVDRCEDYIDRHLTLKRCSLQYDYYAPQVIKFIKGPVVTVEEVKIIKADWSECILPEVCYHTNANKSALIFDVTPMGMIVQIHYLSGYDFQYNNLPEDLKQGLLNDITMLHNYPTFGNSPLEKISRECYADYKKIKL